MITFIKQNRLLVLIASVFVLAVLYYSLFANNTGGNAALLSSGGAAPTPQSQQLLAILANLHTIQLNGAIFSDPVFLSLNDFGVIISPEALGRRNPFAPIVIFNPKAAQTNQTIPTPKTVTPTKPAP